MPVLGSEESFRVKKILTQVHSSELQSARESQKKPQGHTACPGGLRMPLPAHLSAAEGNQETGGSPPIRGGGCRPGDSRASNPFSQEGGQKTGNSQDGERVLPKDKFVTNRSSLRLILYLFRQKKIIP